MGSDNIFVKRKEERKKRQENVRRQKSSNWLMICEGKQTEPNYFMEAVESVNKNLEKEYQLKVKIIGIGKNTTSLVQSVEHMQYEIDNYKNKMIPYGKIFVVFDKDSFSNDAFDTAIAMCEENGYIPLWSNQAIEYWFLLHFNYIDVKMDRNLYKEKINQYFKEKGARYKYKKMIRRYIQTYVNMVL